jgi:hypothetical protein
MRGSSPCDSVWVTRRAGSGAPCHLGVTTSRHGRCARRRFRAARRRPAMPSRSDRAPGERLGVARVRSRVAGALARVAEAGVAVAGGTKLMSPFNPTPSVFVLAAAVCLGCRPSETLPPARPVGQPTGTVVPTESGASAADAAIEIRDGDEYSFSIPRRAQVCILHPATLFDRAGCPPESKPVASPPAADRVRVIAIGPVNINVQGTQRRALLVSTLNRLTYSRQPDRAVAEALAAGMMDEIPYCPSLDRGGVQWEARAFQLPRVPCPQCRLRFSSSFFSSGA